MMNNSTESAKPLYGWTSLTTFNCICVICGTLLNSIALYTMYLDRINFTAFRIYVINLLVINLLHSLLLSLSALLSRLYYANGLCDFFQLSQHGVISATTHANLLMTLNRFWAVAYPLHYRTKHTVPVATCACAAMLAYSQLIALTATIRDALYFRIPTTVSGLCVPNTPSQLVLLGMRTFFTQVFPEMVTVSLIAVILYRRNVRLAQKPGLPAAQIHGQTSSHSSSVAQRGNGPKRSRSNMITFYLMIASILICWTPMAVSALMSFSLGQRSSLIYIVAGNMFSCQVIMDPIMLILASFIATRWKQRTAAVIPAVGRNFVQQEDEK